MSDYMAKQVSEYIDKKIDSINNQNKETEKGLTTLEESQDKDVIDVVEKLVQTDFSNMSTIKDTLKDKLLKRINSQKLESADDDELSFDDLDQVAGGRNHRIVENKKTEE